MTIMDAEIFRAAFDAHTAGRARGEPNFFTRRMAIILAEMDGTKPRDAVLRCEELGLLKAGAWSWFVQNGGITPAQIEQVMSERLPMPREQLVFDDIPQMAETFGEPCSNC